VDLVKNICASKIVLKENYNELDKYMKTFLLYESDEYSRVKLYAKALYAQTDDLDKKLNREKVIVNSETEIGSRSMKEEVIKYGELLCNLSYNCIKPDWLYEGYTEQEFVTRFITPMMDLILNCYNIEKYSPKFIFKPGEQKLEIVKEIENGALNEDDRRLPGPNIDGIVKLEELDLAYCLVEVSGPPCSAEQNYNHFKEDRKKLAKNLKYMLKYIISLKGAPCFRLVSHLKLFGIHLYVDKMYIYSMSMPIWDMPVFKLESEITIPNKPILFPSSVPKFVSRLHVLGEKLNHFADKLMKFLSSSDYGVDTDSSDSDLSACSEPKVSPKKRKSVHE
jgi:hypothetical protein